MSEDVLTSGEGRAMAGEANRILNDPSPVSQLVMILNLPIVMTANLLLGPRHHNLVGPIAIGAIVASLTLAARLYHHGRTPERIEAALVMLARCSDMSALWALLRFVGRQRWDAEKTVRQTARHLPMVRRALAAETRFTPGPLSAWIETLRSGGVESEDLEFVARRAAELDSPLNAEIAPWPLRRRP